MCADHILAQDQGQDHGRGQGWGEVHPLLQGHGHILIQDHLQDQYQGAVHVLIHLDLSVSGVFFSSSPSSSTPISSFLLSKWYSITWSVSTRCGSSSDSFEDPLASPCFVSTTACEIFKLVLWIAASMWVGESGWCRMVDGSRSHRGELSLAPSSFPSLSSLFSLSTIPSALSSYFPLSSSFNSSSYFSFSFFVPNFFAWLFSCISSNVVFLK